MAPYRRSDGDSDLADTLQGIAAAARTTLGADQATVYVVDVDGLTIAGVHTTEVDPERRAFLQAAVGLAPARMPVWGLHLDQKDPLLAIERIDTYPVGEPADASRRAPGAVLGVRLEHASVQVDGDRALLGTLFCSYERPRRFSAARRTAALGLANLATLALANARLQNETAESLATALGLSSEHAALRRVATLVAADARPEVVFAQTAEEVAGLLSVEFGLVARFESGRAQPVGSSWGAHQPTVDLVLPLGGGGALAEVARTGRIARVDDYTTLPDKPMRDAIVTAGFRSSVAAPVNVGRNVWGALLAATTRDTPIGTAAEERLERFTELVALAIANSESQARLVAQASTDPLTGLPNRRTFYERLEVELGRARRHGHTLSLVIVDLDHFKDVNDAHGHLAGDSVLVEAAGRLAVLARTEDTLARVGGEEFAWLLPETDARAAARAAERARQSLADTLFAEVGRVTMSAGVAELRSGMGVTEFFRRADTALYWAKGHGRNTCVSYAPEQEKTFVGGEPAPSGRLALSVERLLTLIREQVVMPVAVLTEFDRERLVVRQVSGQAEEVGIHVGMAIPLEDTFGHHVAEGRLPYVIRDTHAEARMRNLALTGGMATVGAYAGVPIILRDGAIFGTLCCLSPRAESGLGAGDLRLLRIIGAMVAEEIEREGRAERAHGAQRDGVRRVLGGEGFSMVFQPIVELAGGRVVAVEALSRFAAEPRRPPDAWFAEATTLGLGVELELMAIRDAIAHLGELPAGSRLSVNASPATIRARGFVEALAAAPNDRLAIEVTEHAPVEDYVALRAALSELRSNGVQIMVDDAGAGFSSLKHVLDLHPDAIKFDISLTRDIDTDPVRRALVTSLLAFADEIGATIVAEGIETQAELGTLRQLGVTRGQGYLLALPGPGPVPERVMISEAVAVGGM